MASKRSKKILVATLAALVCLLFSACLTTAAEAVAVAEEDSGNDDIDGGTGSDTIYGGDGADTVFGSDGKRIFIGSYNLDPRSARSRLLA